MTILVTGGLGFIGSHTSVELINNKQDVVIVDNLMNSKPSTLDKINYITKQDIPFYKIDVTDEAQLRQVFENHRIEGVIHFAGLKSVGESSRKPVDYYYNNLVSTLTVSKLCLEYNVQKFIFSSSATVYGIQDSPLVEDSELSPTTNPYGETKVICERILQDIAKANSKFKVTILRYFNPVGAHATGLIGESPNGTPNNLMPYITKVAKNELDILKIFGDDYDTPDGTGVRDYIHVVDLAKGHVQAMNNLKNGVTIYNLGTGKGTSVLELVNTFKEVNNIDIPYEIVGRRLGDIGTCYADTSKALEELHWKAELDINDMVRDAWNFEKLN